LAAWELFGHSFAHELGSPLHLLEEYPAILLESEGALLSARGRRYLESIAAAALQVRRLAAGVLALAPLPARPLDPKRVDLSALAWQVVDWLRELEPGRSVNVAVQPGLSGIGDADMLRILLRNLIGNAWKFSAGRALAHIAVRAEDTEYGRAICISDDGVGFDMQDVGRLFTPFARLHDRAQFPGTGLGLALAQLVVERHAGRIWAQASEGHGAKFFFVLGLPEACVSVTAPSQCGD
jgi:light-regulated signal transduction histidine kinase (bacteriophytochrome)